MTTDTPDTGPQAADAYNAEYHTDIPVGEILRRARIHMGLSLEDVESQLRIRSALLEALEHNDVSNLPGRAYAIGFVRSYSEFLGLDGDKMVALFKRQAVGQSARPELNFPVPASESKMPDKYIMAGAIAGLLILILLASLMTGGGGDETSVPDVPVEMQVTETDYSVPAAGADEEVLDEDDTTTVAEATEAEEPEQTAASPAPAPAPQPAAQQQEADAQASATSAESQESRIVIRAIDNSWVEIRDQDGNVLVSRILQKGNYYLLPNDPTLIMDTGSIGALQIVLDGKPLPRMGKMGQIARSISLDPDALRERAARWR